MAGTRGGSVEHRPLIELHAVGTDHSQEFGPEVLRPVGAKKERRMMDSFPSSAFHGFRAGPPCGRAAPPVATPHRPVGAKGDHDLPPHFALLISPVFPCGPCAKDYDVGMQRIETGQAKTREPGLETRQMIRRLFRSRLFIAALSAVISPVVLWALSRFCPPTPQTNSIVPSVTEQTFHLKTLRKGFPPFAYKVEFLGHRPEERSGFLNMQRIPPRWLYVVSVANLTAMDQPMVDISFCFKGQAKFVGIAPKAGKLFIALTSVLPQDDWTFLPNPNQPQPLHLAPLESGKGKCFIIGIFSDETPCTEDIVLSVSCPEGKFEKITPAQWASIGWETK